MGRPKGSKNKKTSPSPKEPLEPEIADKEKQLRLIYDFASYLSDRHPVKTDRYLELLRNFLEIKGVS